MAAPAAQRIFGSYARSDGKKFAAKLRRLQKEHGFWQDLADMEGGTQIETAVDRDPGAGAEVEHAHPALRPVGMFEQLDPGELLQRTRALSDLRARPVPTEQLDHGARNPFGRRLRLIYKLAQDAPATKDRRAAEVSWAFISVGSCLG
jgi:hypothetical protein